MNKNIYKNEDISITPRRGILSNIFIILGFLTPFPIFVNANNLSIYFFEFDFNIVKIPENIEGTPIPIGVFSLSIYIFVVLLRTKSIGYIIKYGFFVLSLLLILLQGFDFIRIPVLIAPIIFLLFLRKIILTKYFPKDGFALGYLSGLLALYSSNIFSYVFLSVIDNNPFFYGYGRQIFGFEIWQYYVTYSAVASLVFGTFVLFLFINYKVMNKIKGFLILTLAFTFFAAFLPVRKASFLDIVLVVGLMFSSLFKNFLNLKIKKYKFIIFSIIAFLSLIGVYFGLQVREDIQPMSRIGPILSAMNLLEIDPFKILFGFESGFGGTSNLIVELVLRTGLIGLISYIGFVLYFFKIYLNSLTKIDGLDKFKNHVVVIFISFNVFIGNLVNLNFATPYFVVNFASILIIFSYIDILSRIKKVEKI